MLLCLVLGCETREEVDGPELVPGFAVGAFRDLREEQIEGVSLLDGLAREQAPRLQRAEVEARSPDRLVLRVSDGRNGSLSWSTTLDSTAAYEIELAARTDSPGALRLFWRTAGEAFSGERSVAWPMPAAGVFRSRKILRGRPGFDGVVVEVRLQFEGATPARVEVEQLRAWGWPQDLAGEVSAGGGTDETFAIRFGNEVRPGFVLSPGEPRQQTLPAGLWRLRGAAIHPGSKAVRLRLAIRAESDFADERTIEIQPIVGTAPEILWQPIDWSVDLPASAVLTYSLDDEPESGSIVVSRLRPLSRRGGPAPRALLVSLDTVRADALGAYGAAGDPTPVLDGLAQHARVFERAFATSPWTLPSHMSMLTGQWAARHAIEGGGRALPDSSWTLAKGLRARGYWTEAWTEGGFLDPRFGFAHGFDRFVVMSDNHRMAASIEGSLDSLAELDVPAFMFLHTYQAHAPYDPDREAFARIAARSPGELPSRSELWAWMETWRADETRRLPRQQLALLEGAYRAGITKVDQLMGRLLEGLADLPSAEPDVLLVTSDHGESFQERTRLLEHGRELFPELLAVPLIIASLGDSPALEPGRSSTLASIADIPATLFALLDLPIPETDGRVLVRATDLDRLRVKASAQPPFEAAYRSALIWRDRIDRLEVGQKIGPVERYDFDSIETRPGPPDWDDFQSSWREDHRGRVEIALRFPGTRKDFSVRVYSSHEILDASILPSISGTIEHRAPSELLVRVHAARPTQWLSLFLESVSSDAGWRVEVPERVGPLELICGTRADRRDPARCHADAADGTDPRATLATGDGGTLRVVRHPGAGIRATGSGAATTMAAGVDPALERQLEALGYAGVELGGAAGSGDPGAVSDRGEAVASRRIELRRTP